jgi:hypothetical protein
MHTRTGIEARWRRPGRGSEDHRVSGAQKSGGAGTVGIKLMRVK